MGKEPRLPSFRAGSYLRSVGRRRRKGVSPNGDDLKSRPLPPLGARAGTGAGPGLRVSRGYGKLPAPQPPPCSPRVWLNKASAASASGLPGVGCRGGGGGVPRPLRGEPRQVRTAGRGQSCSAAFRARARAFSRSPRCGSAASSDPLRARPHFPSPPPPPLFSSSPPPRCY